MGASNGPMRNVSNRDLWICRPKTGAVTLFGAVDTADYLGRLIIAYL